jgi:hypothetical protein
MFRAFIAAIAFACLLLAATIASAGDDGHHGGCKAGHCRGGLFGWRSYSAAERRNFPTCYGGYERYYGGFHANYFRDYPVADDGLNNDRYGWGSGWAW